MPSADTISFPDFDPVTGQPTIDGFTAAPDPGFTTLKAEPGFAEADSVMFEGGSLFPPVVLQCERVVNPAPLSGGIAPPTGDYLAFSIFCSFDATFDDSDVVVLAFKPAGSPPQTEWRRLDIHPVHNSIGAGLGSSAAAETDLDPGLPGDYHVRIDKDPRTVNAWKGTGGTPPWTTASPTNIFTRACSWRPTTVTAATTMTSVPSNGSQLFDIAVNSGGTAGFPQSGVLILEVNGVDRLIGYDSKTNASFADCLQLDTPAGGNVTDPTVTLAEAGWSIEVLVPRTAALGGGATQWIDLNDGFGLYVDIIRWGRHSTAGPDIHAGSNATQYQFPVPALGAPRHNITGSLGNGTPIQNAWFGAALIPSLQTPPGGNLGVGVRFENIANPEASIGARDKNAPAFTAPGGTIEGPNGTHDNVLVAGLRNTDTNAANNVTAEFRLANWGIGAAEFSAWAQPVGAGVPSVISIAASGTNEVTAVWDRANVPSDYVGHEHQCVWVRLTTTGGGAVHFVQDGVRRNMDFDHLSQLEREFEISGVGYAAAGAGDHEFLLYPHIRELFLVRGGGGGDGDGDGDGPDIVGARLAEGEFQKVWVWLVDGFRRTGETITIRNETAEILDPSPGQFGIVATHDDPSHVLGYRIFGDNLEWDAGGFLKARVPKEGKLTGTMQLHAGTPEEVAKVEEEDRRRGKKRGGCLGWILAFLAALVAFIRRLLKR
jgi:hypothetical protein